MYGACSLMRAALGESVAGSGFGSEASFCDGVSYVCASWLLGNN